MPKAQTLSLVANRFPALSRGLLTLSISGYIPPIHRHWFFKKLASELFDQMGFPIWGSSCRLHIPAELRPVYLEYFNFLDHEPLTRRVIAGFLKPGATFLDVGANIGYYTLLAAGRVGPKGKVHSIECSPETFAVLSENVRRNNLKNVSLYQVAAARENGELQMNVSAVGLHWLSLHENYPKTEGTGKVARVPAKPLDDLIPSPVDVVKIDAEGVDLEVLQGMPRILRENPRIALVVEWCPGMLSEAGKDPLELPEWLKSAGFTKISVLDEQTDKPMKLDHAIELVKANRLPSNWVADLAAQRPH